MTKLNRVIFSGLQILLGQEWQDHHAVVVEDGVIKAILHEEMIKHHLPAKQYTFPKEYYLIPGLIDLHIHGADNKDVMDESAEALTIISRALAAEGVTGFLATTMTATSNRIEAVMKTITHAMPNKEGAAILGVHLEGPFIANAKKGAQRAEDIQLPDLALFKQLQHAAKGMIKLITLAPELPHALSLINELHNMGIIVSVGHTNATYAETEAAINAGCSQATHLFNAMRGLHQREPGAALALLLSEQVCAELIVDGVHLHPAVVELALRVKGKEKLLLVTDAMRAKCLGEGQYDLGGQIVRVREQRAELQDGTLAGSILRMPQAIKNMMQYTQCSLVDAIRMASFNPAHVLKLTHCKGTIEVGKDADLVVMNPELEVIMTMREGRDVFVSTKHLNSF